MEKISEQIIKKFKYKSKEEREKHVKEMEAQGFECTGQVKKTDSFGEEPYWYGEFSKYV